MADEQQRPYFDMAERSARRIEEQTGVAFPAELIWEQWAHESYSDFHSRLARENLNFAGLTQVEPNGEENRQPDGKNYYKDYDSVEEFADDYGDYMVRALGKDKLASIHSAEDMARVLKGAGYYTAPLSEYMAAYRESNGGDDYADPFTSIGALSLDSFFYPRDTDFYVGRNEPLPPERSVWDRFSDAFWAGNHDTGDVSAIRYMWAGMAAGMDKFIETGQFILPGFDKPYTPSNSEREYVSELLKDDETARDFVLNNARNSQHLYRLAAMKKEDDDLQKRVAQDSMHNGINIAGGLGGLAGGIITPANIVLAVATMGGGLGAKVLSQLAKTQALARMGTATLKLSPLAHAKALRIARNAILGAGYVGVDRYLANNFGGFEPNYATNMLMGATLSSAFSAFRYLKPKKNKANVYMKQKLDKIETDTVHMTYDTVPPNHLKPKIKTDLSMVHLKDALETIVPKKYRQQFAKLDNMFVLNQTDIKTIAAKHNLNIDPSRQYIVIPGTDIRVFNASKVRSPLTMGKILKQDEMFFALENRAQQILKNTDNILEFLSGVSDVNDKTAQRLIKGLKKQWDKEGIKYGRMANKTILRLVRERADDIKKARQSVHVDKNSGTVYVDGVPYEKDNPLNINTEAEWLADATDVEAYMQGDLPNWIRKGNVSQWLEDGILSQTDYGVLSNSRVKSASKIAHLLFHDDRMRGKLFNEVTATNVMPAERIKKAMSGPLYGLIDKYLDLRNAWIKSQPGLFKYFGQGRKLFDKQVMDAYNWKYSDNKAGHANINKFSDFDPRVQIAADTMHMIRDRVIQFAREDARLHGGRKGEGTSFLSKDWVVPEHDEMIRHVDENALAHWLSDKFKNNRKTAVEYLDKYAHEAGRIEDYGKRLQEDNPDKHIPFTTIQKEFDKACREWAESVIDRGQSQTTFADRGSGTFGNDPITYMRHRFPMDTSLKLDDGFSFDGVLRDNDIETLMKSYINRMTGEIAVNDVLGKWRSNGVLDKISQDWEKAQNTVGGLSPGDVANEKRALEDGLSQVLGVRNRDNPPTVFSAMSQMLRNKTYADVGGQMTWAQMGEYGGAMAYAGTHILFSSLPVFKQLRRAILSQNKKSLENLGQEVVDNIYGKELLRRVWDSNSSYVSKSFRNVMARGSKTAAALDKMNEVVKFTANITSTLNQLPQLTDAMINQGRIAGIIDSIKWGLGDDNVGGAVRKPFSRYYLNAVGIKTEDQARLLRHAIKKYIGDRPTGAKLVARLEKWRLNDTDTYFQWYDWVENYSNKVIQQLSVGGTPLTKERNGFTQLVFQFKDYVLRAINSQMMRALSSRQIDDALAAVYSMGTNLLGYMGLVWLRAFAKYPGDSDERQAYIDRNLTMGRLAWAAVSRGALTGSIPSFISDFYEMATGTPMMRTTVNNSYNPKAGFLGSNGNVGDIAGSVVNEMPAIRTAIDPWFAAGRVGSRAIGENRPFSSEDLEDIVRLMPLNSWWGMTALTSLIEEQAELPSRYKNKRRQQQLAPRQKEVNNNPERVAETKMNKVLTPMSGGKKVDNSAGMSLIMKKD